MKTQPTQARRAFLKQSSQLALAASLPLHDIFAELGMKKQLGIQLFSLPKMLSENFEAGIKMLSGMGYKELELYGPFDFSTAGAQQRWAAVTPQLGFSGSGYFGKNIKEIKKILRDNGLKTPAMHTDLDTLQNGMDRLGEAAQILGQKYATLPAIPDELRKSLDDYKRMAEAFNKIGENAKKKRIEIWLS